MADYKKFLHRKLKLSLHLSSKRIKNIIYRLYRALPLIVAGVFFALFLLVIIQKPLIHLSPDSVLPVNSLFPHSVGHPMPPVSAKNIFVLDLNSQMVLYEKAPDQQIYPASTTKMMTGLVLIDQLPLNQIITVKNVYPEGQTLKFKIGEQLTVEQLLYAMLVYSANDAAEILAQDYPGGRPALVAAMNSKARQMHLRHTHFVNPTGLDEPDHYSSAADLTRLAQTFISNPELNRIMSTENAVITSLDYSSSYVLNNVNELLGSVPGVKGIKTGYTDLAGQSLITLVERDRHPVILAVLGSDDRFGDTKKLIDWIYQNYSWK